jgi:hypothetical protein
MSNTKAKIRHHDAESGKKMVGIGGGGAIKKSGGSKWSRRVLILTVVVSGISLLAFTNFFCIEVPSKTMIERAKGIRGKVAIIGNKSKDSWNETHWMIVPQLPPLNNENKKVVPPADDVNPGNTSIGQDFAALSAAFNETNTNMGLTDTKV